MVVLAPLARPVVLAVDLVAVADDAVVQPIEPVAVAVDLNGALLLRCLLPAAPGDRSAEAVLVALAAPNPLDLLDLLLRLGLLGLLDLLGLAVAKMADAHRLASAGLDDGLDAGQDARPAQYAHGARRCSTFQRALAAAACPQAYFHCSRNARRGRERRGRQARHWPRPASVRSPSAEGKISYAFTPDSDLRLSCRWEEIASRQMSRC